MRCKSVTNQISTMSSQSDPLSIECEQFTSVEAFQARSLFFFCFFVLSFLQPPVVSLSSLCKMRFSFEFPIKSKLKLRQNNQSEAFPFFVILSPSLCAFSPFCLVASLSKRTAWKCSSYSGIVVLATRRELAIRSTRVLNEDKREEREDERKRCQPASTGYVQRKRERFVPRETIGLFSFHPLQKLVLFIFSFLLDHGRTKRKESEKHSHKVLQNRQTYNNNNESATS